MTQGFFDDARVGSNVGSMSVDTYIVKTLLHVPPGGVAWIHAPRRMIREAGDHINDVPRLYPIL